MLVFPGGAVCIHVCSKVHHQHSKDGDGSFHFRRSNKDLTSDSHGTSKDVLMPVFFFLLSLRFIHIVQKIFASTHQFVESEKRLEPPTLPRRPFRRTSCFSQATHNLHRLLPTACGIEMFKPQLICCTFRLHLQNSKTFLFVTLQY